MEAILRTHTRILSAKKRLTLLFLCDMRSVCIEFTVANDTRVMIWYSSYKWIRPKRKTFPFYHDTNCKWQQKFKVQFHFCGKCAVIGCGWIFFQNSTDFFFCSISSQLFWFFKSKKTICYLQGIRENSLDKFSENSMRFCFKTRKTLKNNAKKI